MVDGAPSLAKMPTLVRTLTPLLRSYGTEGPVCSRCTNSKVLSDGACVDSCAAGETTVGTGSDGLECQ